MGTEKLNPCRWCGKRNRTASEWEQCNLSGVWQRLCTRCANRRLADPWNALLPMRKAGSVVTASSPGQQPGTEEGQ